MLSRGNTVLKEEIFVDQNLELSHAGTVWDGALVLSAYLQKQYLQKKDQSVAEELIVGRNLLELGSGTGILGLSLIPFRPASVTMTDLPEYVEFLNHNINLNKELIQKYQKTEGNQIKRAALTWGQLTDHEKHFGIQPAQGNRIHTIIASQVAYSQECITYLLQTLVWFKSCHNKQIKMIFSYQKYGSKERNLLNRLLDYQGPSKFVMAQQQYIEDNHNNIFIEDVTQAEMDEDCRDDYYGILILR